MKAEVLYIHKSFVFMMALEVYTGDKGYLVCDGRKTEYVYSHKDPPKPMTKEKEVQETTAGKMEYGVVMASETSWLKGWFKKMMGVDDSKDGNMRTKGTGVRIHGGAYKGLRGELRDNLGEKMLVSLLSVNKLVVVPSNFVAPDDCVKTMKKAGERELPPTPANSVASHPSAGSVVGSSKSTIQSAFLPDEDGGYVVTAEDCWDPSFLKPVPETGSTGGPSSDGAAQNAAASPQGLHRETPPAREREVTSPAPELAASDAEETSSGQGAQARRRKRQSRIPRRDDSTPPKEFTSPTYQSPTSEDRMASQSPSDLFLKSAPFDFFAVDRDVARTPWLMVGLGVEYLQDGVDKTGWILKVYADTAHVVPSTAAVGDDSVILPLKGADIRPWQTTKRGEEVGVFDGPKRGSKGKVIGTEGTKLYIRTVDGGEGKSSLLFSSASGSSDMVVESKDTARYHRDWENAVERIQNQSASGSHVQTPQQGLDARSPLRGPDDNWAPAWEAEDDKARSLKSDEDGGRLGTPSPSGSSRGRLAKQLSEALKKSPGSVSSRSQSSAVRGSRSQSAAESKEGSVKPSVTGSGSVMRLKKDDESSEASGSRRTVDQSPTNLKVQDLRAPGPTEDRFACDLAFSPLNEVGSPACALPVVGDLCSPMLPAMLTTSASSHLAFDGTSTDQQSKQASNSEQGCNISLPDSEL